MRVGQRPELTLENETGVNLRIKKHEHAEETRAEGKYRRKLCFHRGPLLLALAVLDKILVGNTAVVSVIPQ